MNTDRSSKLIYPFFITSSILILFDQITKLYFKGFNFLGIFHQGYNYGEQVTVIDGILYWTYIENPGMAFGIQFGWGKIFLSLFSIVAGVLLMILITKLRNEDFWVKTGFTLIFSGAVGNLIDRVFYGVIFGESALFYGKVVDFIHVNIPDIDFLGWTHFPVFNIADSCVTLGVSILILFHNKLPNWAKLFPNTNKTQNILDDSVSGEENASS